MEALGATGAVLYLSDPGDGGLRAAAAIGTGCPAPTLADDDHPPFAPAPGRAGAGRARERLGRGLVRPHGGARVHRGVGDRAAARWLDEPVGALVIGEPARELSRDALETVTQTVNRMKSLLRRLREAPHGGSPIGGRT